MAGLLLMAMACAEDPVEPVPVEPPVEPPDTVTHVDTTTATGDRGVLEAIYSATGGDEWSNSVNWLTPGPLDEWYGVVTDGGRVTQLWLGDNGLKGTIPPDIGKLEKLQVLALDQNRLSGVVPPEVGKLTDLRLMWLSWNELTGGIPAEFGGLTKLFDLRLHANKLSGSIPSLAALDSLETLNLSGNELTGPVPAWLGSALALRSLNVEMNRLSGVLPPGLGNLTELRYFVVDRNDLSGGIPPELGNLTRLVMLRTHKNPRMAGMIPRTLMNIPRLQDFAVFETGLCAPLDDAFLEWVTAIQVWYLEEERCPRITVDALTLTEWHEATNGPEWLTRTGWGGDPATVGDWYGVTVVDGRVREVRVPGNGLTGPLGHVWLTGVETIDVSNNQLTGPVTPAIGSAGHLRALVLSGNAGLTGALPDGIRRSEVLHTVVWDGTGLCSPPMTSFTDWRAQLREVRGPVCDSPAEVAVDVTAYMVQSIQRPDGTVPLIHGREALARVFVVTEPEAFRHPAATVIVREGATEVFREVIPEREARTLQEMDERVLGYSVVVPGEYIRDGISIEVVVDSVKGMVFAEGSRVTFMDTPDVHTPPAVSMVVVPVISTANPDSSVIGWAEAVTDTSFSLIRYAFPVGAFTATDREPFITSHNTASGDGQWAIVQDLDVVRVQSENPRSYWYGVAGARKGYVRGVANQTYTSMGKAQPLEVAHEVGHTMGLDHAPCGDPPDADPDFPYAGGDVGVWGYDFRDSTLVDPFGHVDVMSYCSNPKITWLSDYSFEKVLAFREDRQSDRMAAAPAQALIVRGGHAGGTLSLMPALRFHTATLLPERPGPYQVAALDSAGGRVFTFAFDLTINGAGNSFFRFAVPVREGWPVIDRIVLTGPVGRAVLDRDGTGATVVRARDGSIRAIVDTLTELPPLVLAASLIDQFTPTGEPVRR